MGVTAERPRTGRLRLSSSSPKVNSVPDWVQTASSHPWFLQHPSTIGHYLFLKYEETEDQKDSTTYAKVTKPVTCKTMI